MSALTELQSALKRELESGDLTDLEEDFYSKVRKALAELQSSGGHAAPGAASTLIERARRTAEKLFLLRLVKSLDYMLKHGEKPPIRMPREEAEILDIVLKTLSAITDSSPRARAERKERAPGSARAVSEYALIAFRKAYSKVMMPDGRVLGPFQPGDVAIVPKRVADELAASRVAEVIAELR